MPATIIPVATLKLQLKTRPIAKFVKADISKTKILSKTGSKLVKQCPIAKRP